MHNLRAYLAGLAVVCMWSGWITLSRYAVQSQLTPADMTLLRYGTALFCVLPFIFRHNWRKYRLYQYLLVGLGVGFPYTLFSFYGLQTVKAAHAGVLVNGMMPCFGALLAVLVLQQKIPPPRSVAIAIVFAANIMMAGDDLRQALQSEGMLMLLLASLAYSVHMTAIRRWNFSWQETLATVPVVNMLLFAPLWPLFPSKLREAAFFDIAVQALYQGVVVNVVALICVVYAVRHLGTVTVSLFIAFVPVTTALLAWLLLGETLSSLQLLAIIVCSLGLILYARGRWF